MHKSVLVYDSGYTIVPQEVTTVEEQDIPIMTMPQQPEVVQMTANQKIDNQITEQQNRILQYIESDTKPQQTVTKVQTQQVAKPQTVTQPKTTTVTKQVQTPVQQTVYTPPTPAPVQTVTKTVSQPQTQQVTQSAPTGHTQTVTPSAPIGNSTKVVSQPVAKPQTTTVAAPQPMKVMTAQEEEIAWNRWRSNLQNQIMRDAKLPNVPNGVVFKFSFTVDKYGKVTNVKTWSTTAQYTPYAIQYIAPVIRSYQGHSILNFPAGSSRVITDVTGGWKISTNAKFSTPQDYNDIEKVTR